jgi:hypothetical protein
MVNVPTTEMKVASGIHIVPQTASMNLFRTENSYLCVLASWREILLPRLGVRSLFASWREVPSY